MNDGCLFNPIGFSMNGLNKNGYYTIHVTPQASCSYVSFETNIKRKDYSQIVNQVVDIFKPNKFIITLFSTKVSWKLTHEKWILEKFLESFIP